MLWVNYGFFFAIIIYNFSKINLQSVRSLKIIDGRSFEKLKFKKDYKLDQLIFQGGKLPDIMNLRNMNLIPSHLKVDILLFDSLKF